jgi:uncharacterized SAM-binding protein YcdF (DUF218 family)
VNKSKSRIVWVTAAATAGILVILLRSTILAALGGYLVQAGEPHKADIVLVLAGDFLGNRILKAATLVREGDAPEALVSGPPGVYGYYESDLAIPFAVKRGYPESYFVNFKNQANSTMDEARAAIPEMRRKGVKRVLLVTSNFHTRRSGRIFRGMAPDMTFYVVAAGDPYFSPQGWWKTREGRKTFVIEWMKTIAEWIGL